MIKNYLKIAFRNLWNNKGFSAINIAGLAVGLATCLLMLFYVTDELGYDKFNEKADRIFRVDGDIKFGGNHFVLAVAPDPLGPVLKKDFPQVEQYTRLRGYGGLLVKKGSQNISEDGVIYADSTLFDVFTLPMLQGDPTTALSEPKSVVITEKVAKKYFNSTDVVGRNLIINDTGNLKITGVIKDIPAQSHFHFDFFVSLSTNDESRKNNWVSNNFNTYVVLRKGADPKKLESQFGAMVLKYVGPQVKQLMNIDMDDFTKSGNFDTYNLMPLTSIHLHSNKTAELGTNSNVEFVYIFSFIAFLILLIACVNFMNLSTARSSNRAKEVGVRKVLGSLRKSLIAQFLTESILVSLLALVIAIGITFILLPYFNQLSGKEIGVGIFSKAWLFPSLIALMLVVGVIAGSYPAFFLSGFRPVEVLKGKLAKGFKSSLLRSGLVIFQFFISIALIMGTIVIYNQLQFIRSKDLGYDRSHVVVVKNTYPLGNKAKVFRDGLLNISGVQKATMTGFLPTSDWRSDSPLFPDATLDQKKAVSAQIWAVDENYIPTLDMHMLKGRNFSKEFPTDSTGIILNEAAAKLLGFDDPLNKTLYYTNDIQNSKSLTAYHILGVVKNFNFSTLREEVIPLALVLREQNGSISFRINTSNLPGLLAQVESKWKTMASSQPFNYSFMDEDFNNIYKSEQQTGKIFISFAGLAIFIACLGLFGLVTYAAEQRTKEIGIRKVLGASVSTIVSMLSKDFLKLIIIAAFIAFPVSWWAMNSWLQHFAYRISIAWWVFAVAGSTALVIALFTIGVQAVKAAIANPVKSLRTE
ncbi:MAG: ABC transporter permease [Ginsengibacter sp.]